MHKKIEDRRMEVLGEKTNAMLEKYGWFFHYVPLGDGIANIHTHGVLENFGHKDIQITIMLPQDVAQGLMNGMVGNIKEGYSYTEGFHSNVIQNFDVEIKGFNEGNRPVLRVILPDTKGNFPSSDKCESPYNTQYNILED